MAIINNSLPALFPESRDTETLEIIRMLAREGIGVLAYATYPEDGYSYVMLIDARKSQRDLVLSVMDRAWNNRLDRLEAREAGRTKEATKPANRAKSSGQRKARHARRKGKEGTIQGPAEGDHAGDSLSPPQAQ